MSNRLAVDSVPGSPAQSPKNGDLKVVVVDSQKKVTLEDVLQNKLPAPLDLESFRKFCIKLCCEENLDFVFEANALGECTELGECRKRFRAIYEKYIDVDSKKRINLSSKDIEQLQTVNKILDTIETAQILDAVNAARKTIMFNLRHETLSHFLRKLVIAKHISLAKDIALWWRRPMSFAEFFSFPDPVNVLETRLHAFCCVCLILINFLLVYKYSINFLGIYIVYGYLTRAIAGPKLDPQAFVVIFVLRPLVEDYLGLFESSFSHGLPRRCAQSVGLLFSSCGLVLQFFGFYLESYCIWGILLFFSTLQSIFNFCMVCFFFEIASFLGIYDGEDVQYVSRKRIKSTSTASGNSYSSRK